MRQLAGLVCVICQRTVDSVVEGRFCPQCNAPVHKECMNAPVLDDEGKCPRCGADDRYAVSPDEPEHRPAPPPGWPSAPPPPPAPPPAPFVVGSTYSVGGLGT